MCTTACKEVQPLIQQQQCSPIIQPSYASIIDAEKEHNNSSRTTTSTLLSDWKKYISSEIQILARMSTPLMLTYTLQNSFEACVVLLVGRLGANELAASALGIMIASVTGWLIAIGGTTVLDTLGSQIWNAAQQQLDGDTNKEHQLDRLLQQSIIVLTFMFIPIAILWCIAEPVLLSLGQHPLVSRMTQEFLRWLIPGAPAYIAFEAIKKYFQVTKGNSHMSTLILCICLPCHLLVAYALVWHFGFGVAGAAAALSITHWLMLIGMLIYAGGHKTRQWITIRQGNNDGDDDGNIAVWKIVSRVVPVIMMLGAEYVAFDTMSLLAGMMGDKNLAAQSILTIADDVLSTIPLSLSIATSSRVAHWVAQGLPAHAYYASLASVILAIGTGLILMAMMLLFRGSFGYLFSSDVSVVMLVQGILPWAACIHFIDTVAGACNGSIRAISHGSYQQVVFIVHVVCYCIIGLPVGAALAFVQDFGLVGLWMGLFLALSLVSSIQAAMLLKVDWKHQTHTCI